MKLACALAIFLWAFVSYRAVCSKYITSDTFFLSLTILLCAIIALYNLGG